MKTKTHLTAAITMFALSAFGQTNQTITGNLTVDGNTNLGNSVTADTTAIKGVVTVARTLNDITAASSSVRMISTFTPTMDNLNGRSTGNLAVAETSTSFNLSRGLDDGGSLHGVEGRVELEGTGNVTAAVGISGRVLSTANNTTLSAVALMSQSPSVTGGTITKSYGVYILDQDAPGVGNGYGVFSQGATSMNVFAGATRIGGTTDPASGVELDVTGDVAISGTLTVAGNQLPPLASLLTASAADVAFHKKENNQIILGQFNSPDTDAALIVGNGSPGNLSNTAVIGKNGNISASGLSVTGIASFSGSVAMTGGASMAGPLSVGMTNSVTGAKANAIGTNLTVSGAHQFVIGRYNKNEGPSTDEWVAEDPLFVVANGTDQTPNNAFVVKKSGLVKIGDIEIDPVSNTVKVPQKGDIEMGDYN